MKIKHLVMSILPEAVIDWIKIWYYPLKLKYCGIDHEPEMSGIAKLVSPGDVVIDIGANYGLYTIFLSRCVGIHGKVYSFEPVDLTFNLLKRNIDFLDLRNTICYKYAASDDNHDVTMLVPKYRSGRMNYFMASITSREKLQDRNYSTINVSAKRIDDIVFSSNEVISFIKCDVEGHEFPALIGASKIIQRDLPALMVEVSGDPDSVDGNTAELINMMKELDYQVYWYDGSHFKQRSSGIKKVNYFFLQQKHIL